MAIGRRDLLKGIAVGAAGGLTVKGAPSDSGAVIFRDVCVLGGGSSGTYTAVRLRDLGKSVVVVESKGRLGGHCETFHDSVTGGAVDIGVIIFHDLPIVRNYFSRFNVPLVPFFVNAGVTSYVDYRTGQIVNGYTPPSQQALGAALGEYFGALLQYPYLASGFDLPDPVPPPLLSPFGAFVSSLGLDAMVQTVFSFYAEGLGDLLSLPTIYVMKNFGIQVLTSLFANSFLSVVTPIGTNNSLLYERATAFLGQDALLSSQVISVNRHDPNRVQLRVSTPDGQRVIQCSKLVVTFPPLLPNFQVFDLDAIERSVFTRFSPKYYATAVARLTGIPVDVSVVNVAPDTPYNLPPLPGIYSVYPTGLPNLFNVKYGSSVPLDNNQVQTNIKADLQRLTNAGFPVQLDSVQPLPVFSSHSPFELTVSAADIASGFYGQLYALQGHKNTFYNGAALHTHDSSLLWEFTERLLPEITA
jgi:hypothetical protein